MTRIVRSCSCCGEPAAHVRRGSLFCSACILYGEDQPPEPEPRRMIIDTLYAECGTGLTCRRGLSSA